MQRLRRSVLLLCAAWLLCCPFAQPRCASLLVHKQLGSHLTQHPDRPQIAAETAQLNAEIERLGGTPLEPAAGGAATPVDLPVDLPTARGRRKSKGRKRG